MVWIDGQDWSGSEEVRTGFWSGNIRIKDHLEDAGKDGTIH